MEYFFGAVIFVFFIWYMIDTFGLLTAANRMEQQDLQKKSVNKEEKTEE